jgi:hypothetical protein
MVRKRRKPTPPEPAADDEEYFKDLRELMSDEEHMDCVFVIRTEDTDGKEGGGAKGKGSSKSGASAAASLANAAAGGVRAHKSILTARGEYFRALFRKAHFVEATTCVIAVDPCFSYRHICLVLEFLYTNRIADLAKISTDDLLSLLHLSDKWMLRDLKRIVEHELIHHMSLDTVARMYGATEDFHAQRLAKACIEYIMGNLRQLAGNPAFEEDMKNYPLLCIPVLKAAADLIPDPPGGTAGPAHKKQRLGDTPLSQSGARLGSSPVPDSDA